MTPKFHWIDIKILEHLTDHTEHPEVLDWLAKSLFPTETPGSIHHRVELLAEAGHVKLYRLQEDTGPLLVEITDEGRIAYTQAIAAARKSAIAAKE